jgi:hypothetical protein
VSERESFLPAGLILDALGLLGELMCFARAADWAFRFDVLSLLAEKREMRDWIGEAADIYALDQDGV